MSYRYCALAVLALGIGCTTPAAAQFSNETLSASQDQARRSMAQVPGFGNAQGIGNGMPSDEALKKSQEDARRRFNEATQTPSVKRADQPAVHPVQRTPEVNALPKPIAQSKLDVAAVADQYKSLGANAGIRNAQSPTHELLIFASFSMPRENLDMLVSQADRLGAVIVMRGFKDNSMKSMGRAIADLVGNRNVSVHVHPPAFKQFKIEAVPAFVLSRSENSKQVSEEGCAPDSSFVKVSGDVTVEYALEQFERRAGGEWEKVAKAYLSRFRGNR